MRVSGLKRSTAIATRPILTGRLSFKSLLFHALRNDLHDFQKFFVRIVLQKQLSLRRDVGSHRRATYDLGR